MTGRPQGFDGVADPAKAFQGVHGQAELVPPSNARMISIAVARGLDGADLDPRSSVLRRVVFGDPTYKKAPQVW